jgi:choline dehydrogenase-like flavoprotein
MLHATLQLKPCPRPSLARSGCEERGRERQITSKLGASFAAATIARIPTSCFTFSRCRCDTTAAVATPGAVDFGTLFALLFSLHGMTPTSLSHGYQVHVGPMNSNSRGSVLAVSPDVADKPAIWFNYLSTREDEEEWVQAIQKAREILRQPAFSEYNGGEASPGPSVSSPDDILEWVRRDGETAYHPSCTCKMATDDMAVVDPSSMRVHGLKVCCMGRCCVQDE